MERDDPRAARWRKLAAIFFFFTIRLGHGRCTDSSTNPPPNTILNQKADLALGDLSINFDREKAVDFTMPFLNTGM